MAVEDEYSVPTPKRAVGERLPVPGRTLDLLDVFGVAEHCRFREQPSLAVRIAVDAFAREHLLRDIDEYGLGTPDATLPRGMKRPIADGVYDKIELGEQNQVGLLFVGQNEWRRGRSVWAASNIYCLHVHRTPRVIEVVIEALGSVIS
ncbi:MAG TPA: hypothetical protein VGM90_05350 [Kofleriaceae bacterium]|jgi:hypothetical protein